LIFQEYLAAIALSQHEDMRNFVLTVYKDALWNEVIALSVAYIARVIPSRSNEVMHALLDTQEAKGILLAGKCFVGVDERNIDVDLKNAIKASLLQLATAEQVPDVTKDEARSLLNKINGEQPT
jgi:hypothetical protein